MSVYAIGKTICKMYLSLVIRAEAIGQENIPKEGPVLLCSNHISNYDPPLVGSFMKRKIHFMAKEELFSQKILGSLLPSLGAFPVKRGAGDRQALRKGLSLLEEGKVLCLFPEGTRSKTGEVGKGLSGSGFFALRSEAAVVPVAVFGKYKPFQKVTVVYGKPLNFQQLRNQKTSAADATEEIMDSIRKLMAQHQAEKNK
ncbi:lysophospholipid acyltransferase family protein [Alteribacillus bidgolensis]|uniref:1-acyl-sn-glycerol-3-phosphate acyltransferase n=1 Tax=Alteribacillus bidgolensis TaxID=930129 RepID=A0A1G8C350_9BACI|nr:lysophospholipid acyltransferase family protein [Alteribacillus bidgolensis]SDH39916.1 1-acyl-sn-glycerol-3-phosphate acyltransferase [Alteribacillus bidgolensis]